MLHVGSERALEHGGHPRVLQQRPGGQNQEKRSERGSDETSDLISVIHVRYEVNELLSACVEAGPPCPRGRPQTLGGPPGVYWELELESGLDFLACCQRWVQVQGFQLCFPLRGYQCGVPLWVRGLPWVFGGPVLLLRELERQCHLGFFNQL